jgi:hypothetical protein
MLSGKEEQSVHEVQNSNTGFQNGHVAILQILPNTSGPCSNTEHLRPSQMECSWLFRSTCSKWWVQWGIQWAPKFNSSWAMLRGSEEGRYLKDIEPSTPRTCSNADRLESSVTSVHSELNDLNKFMKTIYLLETSWRSMLKE